MDDNGLGNMLLNVAIAILVVLIGIAGYWVKRRIDFSNKKKGVRFEGQSKAADKILRIINDYVVSSKRLCEKNVSGEGLTIDVCIHAYKEKVGELAKLRSELAASGQFMRYFDKGAREEAEKINFLLSAQLGALEKTFEAAEIDWAGEDGGEMLRIMRVGISKYCDKFTKEISPVMRAVKEGVEKV